MIDQKLLDLATKLRAEKRTFRDISNTLNLPRSSLHRDLAQQKKPTIPKKRIYSKIISPRVSRRILRHIKIRPNFTLRGMIATLKLTCSPQTLSRFLKLRNFSYKKIKVKPFLTVKSKAKRLVFAKNTIYIPDLTEKLVFTDEKVFYLSGFKTNSQTWTNNNDKKPNNIRLIKYLV
jgi:hypothetical protein